MTLTSYLLISLFFFVWALGMSYCHGAWKNEDNETKVVIVGVFACLSLFWWAVMIWLFVIGLGEISDKQLRNKEKEDDQ